MILHGRSGSFDVMGWHQWDGGTHKIWNLDQKN